MASERHISPAERNRFWHEYQANPTDRTKHGNWLTSHEGLVVAAIGRYYPNMPQYLFDRAVEAGREGVLEAGSKYDPGKGEFSTYANFWIRRHIQKFMQDETRDIRIPRYAQEAYCLYLGVVKYFCNTYGREPTEAEVGRCIGCPEELVHKALQACTPHAEVSLQGLVQLRSSMDEGPPLLDMLADATAVNPEQIVVGRPDLIDVPVDQFREEFASLPARKKAILLQHLGHEQPLVEVGISVHVSRQRTSQIVIEEVKKLRQTFGISEGLPIKVAQPTHGRNAERKTQSQLSEFSRACKQLLDAVDIAQVEANKKMVGVVARVMVGSHELAVHLDSPKARKAGLTKESVAPYIELIAQVMIQVGLPADRSSTLEVLCFHTPVAPRCGIRAKRKAGTSNTVLYIVQPDPAVAMVTFYGRVRLLSAERIGQVTHNMQTEAERISQAFAPSPDSYRAGSIQV